MLSVKPWKNRLSNMTGSLPRWAREGSETHWAYLRVFSGLHVLPLPRLRGRRGIRGQEGCLGLTSNADFRRTPKHFWWFWPFSRERFTWFWVMIYWEFKDRACRLCAKAFAECVSLRNTMMMTQMTRPKRCSLTTAELELVPTDSILSLHCKNI